MTIFEMLEERRRLSGLYYDIAIENDFIIDRPRLLQKIECLTEAIEAAALAQDANREMGIDESLIDEDWGSK